MKIGASFGLILKAVIVCGCIYAFVKWEFDKPQDNDASDFAEKSCVDEIDDRFDVTTVSAYSVNETNNGYVVRASVTLAKGTRAKVYCLTNTHGRVKEIMIEER